MAHVDLPQDGDRIVVTSQWSEKELIKSIPGSRWDGNEKVWTLPLTWTACLQLRGVFGKNLVIGSGLSHWAAQEKGFRVAPTLEIRQLTDRAPSPMMPWTEKLYSFQRAGVNFLLQSGSSLLADEMGTGKTVQGLSTLRALHESSEEGLPALVVCPNSMKAVWAREAGVWFPEAVPYVVKGTAVQRRKTLDAAKQDPRALVIINFESVRAHSRVAGFGSIRLTDAEKTSKELNEFSFKVTIVDEAHRMKDPNAKQTRAIWSAAGDSPRRIAMTGTPIAHNAADLWSVMHFVSPDEFPTKSKFVDRYCATQFNAWGGLEIGGLNKKNEDEFHAVLAPRFRRMPKALVLPQLPPKVRLTRYVGMTAGQQKMYDQMSSGLVSRLPDGSLLVAKENIAAQTRLLQFSSATMEQTGEDPVTGDPVYRMCDPSPKLDVMMEIIEDMGDKPIAVAFHHAQLLELAAARLEKAGIVHAKLYGKTPQWQRDSDIQKFQKGEIPVFLFTIQAGGVGITLNHTDTILFVQRSWSMLENAQAEDRVHRIGSEKFQQVNVIDLVTEGSIEEHQIDTVVEKKAKEQEVVQDAKILAAAGAL